MGKSDFWHVLYVRPQTDAQVASKLTERGFLVYAPKYREMRRVRRTTKTRIVEKVLFPRYVFASAPAGVPIHRVLDVPEVLEVLRNNDVPLLVPGSVILELMDRQGDGAFDRLPAVLQVGQSVKLLGGAFAGHIARIKSLLSEEAARVVVTIFGREVVARVPVDQIRKSA